MPNSTPPQWHIPDYTEKSSGSTSRGNQLAMQPQDPHSITNDSDLDFQKEAHDRNLKVGLWRESVEINEAPLPSSSGFLHHAKSVFDPERRNGRRGIAAHEEMLKAIAKADDEAFGKPLTVPSNAMARSSKKPNILDEELEKGKIEPKDARTNKLLRMKHSDRERELVKYHLEEALTSMVNRRNFFKAFVHVLLYFGAPTHRLDRELKKAAEILDVPLVLLVLPNVVCLHFIEEVTATSETYIVKELSGCLQLGRVHEVHDVYLNVINDRITAKVGALQLKELRDAKPVYGTWTRCWMAYFLSAVACPLTFGGSFVDGLVAGIGAFCLSWVKQKLSTRNSGLANIFEIVVVVAVAFVARGISIAAREVFCFTAISSAAIVSILPGLLVLTSSMEISTRNMLSGGIKMVYSMMLVIFLGYGIQLGSELYCLVDERAYHMVKMAMIHLTGTLTMAGGWVADNSDPTYLPAISPFIFSDAFPSSDEYLILGCFRPQNDPWYLQTPPAWTQLILVPLYSFFSSLVNLQPISNDGMKWDKTKGVYRRRRHNRQDFIAMIIIACISYGVHQWAYYCMPNYQNGVPLVGGLVLGILGNVYAFASNGTAFSVMATGVFLMLPTGLAASGGIGANIDTIDIWTAMVLVTSGLTVGLYYAATLFQVFVHWEHDGGFSF